MAPLVGHILLEFAAASLAGAGYRAASAAGALGLMRAIATAVLAAGAAVVWALLLGLVALGTSPAALTVAADNQNRPFGSANHGLTTTISGFVNGDTAAVIYGGPSCTTAAVQYSPGGSYPIVCTQGTSSAANYTFGPFVPGTLKVGYTTTITGTVSSLTVSSGQSILIAPGAVVNGPLNVQAGGALDVEGATTSGIASSGAVAIRICGATTAKLILVGSDGVAPPVGSTL